MRRSEIDTIIDETIAILEAQGTRLPPFAHWSPAEWRAPETRTMRERFLGWAVVEFEPGAFAKAGIALCTTRMGSHHDLAQGRGRLYGEKVFVLRDQQYVPFHHHAVKTEDVINRGGATLAIELVRVDAAGRPSREPVEIERDGLPTSLAPQSIVRLAPGESITLTPGIAHAFWAEGGDVVCGEVSLANDERTDNLFLSALPAPAPIVEDAPARRLVVADYAAL